ncbi:OLC1v1018197C1 [Oldenlandia corymbosa var. corymbosa]|uniref:OLC1v1018197C1 n=1 Tax=Oldenlandia corymbosa var. corymbosa TaxID=529605 RepID=A0AAV1EB16_OLDCO|nr:OLC1v1018197C1 [Oldenlandia corymbosa var. corymbosa]
MPRVVLHLSMSKKCTNKKSAVSVEADVLYSLQAELLELEVQLPEGELLLDLISKVESCGSRCLEELPRIGIELKKACCRVKVLKALESKMTSDFLEQLIAEANVLQIEKEKLFVDISELAVEMVWEERAKEVLSNEAKMSEFEDILSFENQASSLIIRCIVEAGLSFRLEFALISKLQDACSTLRWCFKGLAVCDVIPALQVGSMPLALTI